jgi:transposase
VVSNHPRPEARVGDVKHSPPSPAPQRALFEALAIHWLTAASQSAIAERMGLSWDEVHGIMERAVERGLARRKAEPLPRLGVDEKAFRKRHAKHLGEAVDRVRRRENKTLRAAGDDRLKGTRYDWLRHPAGMEPKDRREFAALRDSNLKTARAWALKEAAMALFSYIYERPARKHFRWWHGWAVRSRLQPMVETARMMKRRLEKPSAADCAIRMRS